MPDIKFSNQYPYTDFHELNLDWVISQVKYWSERVGKSIQTIAKTGTVGLVDTYTITYSDGTTSTFDVTNGNGISSVAKTGTAGLVDTYTITYSDGTTTTFEVHNGTASIDTTLTLSNYAADAKVVGDRALLGTKGLFTLAEIVAPYDNCNTLPKNSIVSYIVAINSNAVANLPPQFSNGTIITLDYNSGETTGVQVQIAIPNGNTDNMSYRNNWGGNWRNWRQVQSPANVTAAITAALSSYAPKTVTDLAVYGHGSIYATTPPAPYNDMNTFTTNTILGIAAAGNTIANAPTGFTSGTIVTLSYTNAGSLITIQFVFQSSTNEIYFRSKYSSTWTAWSTLTTYIVQNFGTSTTSGISQDAFTSAVIPLSSVSMFSTLGVIGDSFSAGGIKSGGNIIDCRPLSWASVMGRRCGISIGQFNSTGADVARFLTTTSDWGISALEAADPQDAYIIVLGINTEKSLYDSSVPVAVGTTADIDMLDYTNNADTFCGHYGEVITRIQAHAPGAPIILTIPVGYATAPKGIAITAIGALYGLPVISMSDDYYYSTSFYSTNKEIGHPTAPSYSAMSFAFERQINKCIADNATYFNNYRPQ